MNFDNTLFNAYVYIIGTGIGIGFGVGFIAWAIGFGIYGIIKWFKMA